MRETAFAKINLALHVRARRPDGYHEIETVYAFAEDGDDLSVAVGEGLTLDVTGPFADALDASEDNLVLKAARALCERDGNSRSARLTLDKRLPVAAGLGGGSADAAGALRLLRAFWRLAADETDLYDIATDLGADVAACLASRPARGEGKGERLRFIEDDGISGTPLLLVNPVRPLSTPAVFRAWDGVDRGPLRTWQEGRNDLESAAMALVPEIAEVLDALEGARFARLSGSGATCFGLYSSEAERNAAAEAIATDHSGWWIMTTRLR
jgi:4-diphosphocytidyl-2-C-methyl-D-erythritol kinase